MTPDEDDGQRCLFCGGDAREPEHLRHCADHLQHCDGRQGHVEANEPPAPRLEEIVEPNRCGWGTLTNKERFDRFHAANPGVYRELTRLARHLRVLGIVRTGIQLLVERLRWSHLETHGDPYKICNAHCAFYARLIMEQEPDLDGFFITRPTPNDPEYWARVAAVDEEDEEEE